MNHCEIILKGFNPLFAQWLNEKLNCEKDIKCTIWNDSRVSEAEVDENKKLIVIQQFRNKHEIELLKQTNFSEKNILLVGWWSGDALPEEDIIRTLNMGASAIISERQDWNEILDALNDVNKNSFHYNHLVSRALLHFCRRSNSTPTNIDSTGSKLAEREKKIIELRRSGKTSKEIGDVMFLSKKTIDKLFGDLYRRYDCSNFFELLTACEFHQGNISILST